MIQMNLLTKQKETHRLRKQTHGCQGKGWLGLWEDNIQTVIFKMYNQQKPTV